MITVAIRSFAERGYEGTSMRDIARSVGVTPASLYNHFPAKEDLLWAIVSDAIGELEHQVTTTLDGLQEPEEQLVAFVRTHVAYHANNARKARIVNSLLQALSSERYGNVREFRDRYDRRVRAILDAGVKRGVFKVSSTKITSFAILQMGMAIADWYRPSGSMSVDEICRHYADLALRMTSPVDPPSVSGQDLVRLPVRT